MINKIFRQISHLTWNLILLRQHLNRNLQSFHRLLGVPGTQLVNLSTSLPWWSRWVSPSKRLIYPLVILSRLSTWKHQSTEQRKLSSDLDKHLPKANTLMLKWLVLLLVLVHLFDRGKAPGSRAKEHKYFHWQNSPTLGSLRVQVWKLQEKSKLNLKPSWKTILLGFPKEVPSIRPISWEGIQLLLRRCGTWSLQREPRRFLHGSSSISASKWSPGPTAIRLTLNSSSRGTQSLSTVYHTRNTTNYKTKSGGIWYAGRSVTFVAE